MLGDFPDSSYLCIINKKKLRRYDYNIATTDKGDFYS